MNNTTIFKLTIIGIISGILLNGFVFVKLWEWFITPVFHVDGITIAQSVGIALIFNFLTYNYDKADNDKENKNLENKKPSDLLLKFYGRIFGKALGALFFGWVITLFM
jgi:hypothetical protein